MRYDVLIVGAGIMGIAAAYELSKRGGRILLADQFSIPNVYGSSYDYSRIFRYEYGFDTFYTLLAVESLRLWKQLEVKSGKTMYHPCGMLLLGNDRNEYALTSYKSLQELGHMVSLFNTKDLHRYYPQFQADYGVFDHHGGILDARVCIETLLELSLRNGVEILSDTRVERIDNNKVYTQDGVLIADHILVTAGCYVKHLLGDDIPVTTTRQEIVYFRPKDIASFTPDVFPAFSYADKGFYGLPIFGINAVKLAHHLAGKTADVTKDRNRIVSSSFIAQCRQFIETFIPSLRDAEILTTNVGFYDMSPDENFILQKLSDTLTIGTGFSGHGFKFAPLIGKILAGLVTSEQHFLYPFSDIAPFLTKD